MTKPQDYTDLRENNGFLHVDCTLTDDLRLCWNIYNTDWGALMSFESPKDRNVLPALFNYAEQLLMYQHPQPFYVGGARIHCEVSTNAKMLDIKHARPDDVRLTITKNGEKLCFITRLKDILRLCYALPLECLREEYPLDCLWFGTDVYTLHKDRLACYLLFNRYSYDECFMDFVGWSDHVYRWLKADDMRRGWWVLENLDAVRVFEDKNRWHVLYNGKKILCEHLHRWANDIDKIAMAEHKLFGNCINRGSAFHHHPDFGSTPGWSALVNTVVVLYSHKTELHLGFLDSECPTEASARAAALSSYKWAIMGLDQAI